MGQEIEKKFLVNNKSWKEAVDKSYSIEQGYFETGSGLTVRVRVQNANAFLTIKGKTSGISRSEFEYEIPIVDAQAMLKEFCAHRIVKKVRHIVRHEGHIWEVDEFDGANAGLVMAEIELSSEQEAYVPPPWVGKEVSFDKRFTNASLATNPYNKWATT